jgi:hypothetical protein
METLKQIIDFLLNDPSSGTVLFWVGIAIIFLQGNKVEEK